MGRAPRTKETLPDFLKWRRVTRHPLVFRGLTGSQRTPGFRGVTPSLLSRVIESQGQDVEIVSIWDRVQVGTGDEGWAIHIDGSLLYTGRVVVS